MRRSLRIPPVVLVAVLALGCGGGGTDLEALATAAAGTPPSDRLEIRARAVKFDKDTLVAPAGREVVVALDNQDTRTLHNVAVYRGKEIGEPLYRGELFEGRETREYRFEAPQAGVYYFRCDAHPEMDGAFITR